MTFRGVYRDGVVIIDDPSGFHNGEVVSVSKSGRRTLVSKTKSPVKKVRRTKSKDPLLALAGIWKHRPELKGKSTLEVLAELRAKSLGESRVPDCWSSRKTTSISR